VKTGRVDCHDDVEGESVDMRVARAARVVGDGDDVRREVKSRLDRVVAMFGQLCTW